MTQASVAVIFAIINQGALDQNLPVANVAHAVAGVLMRGLSPPASLLCLRYAERARKSV